MLERNLRRKTCVAQPPLLNLRRVTCAGIQQVNDTVDRSSVCGVDMNK